MPRGLSRRSRDAAGDDRGVTIILVALTMVALMLVVAMVIDYGAVRNTRQASKSTADASTTAGLQLLAPKGVPLPWQGVCSALEYLEANRPELTLDVTYLDGNDDEVTDPDTGADPCTADSAFRAVPCTAVPSTWARIRAVDGTFVARIESAYALPDATFPEDSASYSGDVGDPLLSGCDQLAVIIGNTDDPFFGGVAGATNYDTMIRSVGRVKIGNENDVAIALVLLEQEDCQTLNFPSGSGALTVLGTGSQAGIIHADSSGLGDDCGSGDVVIEGKQNSGPRVRALAAKEDSDAHGIVSTYARFLRPAATARDAHWTPDRMDQGTEVWMCDPYPGTTASATPCATNPVGNRRVTRKAADERYLAAVEALRVDAQDVFDDIADNPAIPPDGYSLFTDLGGDCSPGGSAPPLTTITPPPPPSTSTKLYVNCSTLNVGNGKTVVIDAGFTEVAFQGSISFSGAGTLEIERPERVFVNNSGNAADAIATAAQGRVFINTKGLSGDPCPTYTNDDDARFETTEIVVRSGGLRTQAGGAAKLCSTFVHLMGGSSGDDSPVDIDAATYPAPYANLSHTGTLNVGAGSDLQWTAPNRSINEHPTEGAYEFEDLGLWTETQKPNLIGGGGTLVMTGIYFLPNTGPSSGPGGLELSGGTSGAIDLDAQLWVRKLHFNGGAEFRIRSNPAESLPTPLLEGLGLVR